MDKNGSNKKNFITVLYVISILSLNIMNGYITFILSCGAQNR